MKALFAYDGGTLADAADAVANAIGVSPELHDSSFCGGDDYAARRDPDQVVLLENYMEEDGEPFFPTQPVGAICVQVIGFDEVRAELAGIAELRAVCR